MSGHSHWAGIKHKKGAADAQRSKLFSKLTAEIIVAAKEGGANPDSNTRLRTTIDKAKEMNMPSDNIERAIKKGSGEDTGAQLEELLLEAYGPGGIALLISGITDNRNRTLGDVKQILGKYQGKLVEGGAVRWLFDHKGVLSVKPALPKEELELEAIEAGAEDLYWREDGLLDVYTQPGQLDQVKKKLEEKKLEIESASIDWVPKEHVQITWQERSSAEKLFEELDENDSVQEIYSNVQM